MTEPSTKAAGCAPAVSVEQAVVSFGRGRRRLMAVDHVDLELREGEVLGLIGETGSGKTTLLRAIASLVGLSDGTIRVRSVGRDAKASPVQVVFQNSMQALDPRIPVWRSVAEPMAPTALRLPKGLRSAAAELLSATGVMGDAIDRLPGQLSGGQRQRVTIARALASGAKILLLDEPVSALDVSIQAEILALLRRLRDERNLTYLVISHDLNAVSRLADRVAVMYLGKLVEIGAIDAVLHGPRHPYTRALLSAAMHGDTSRRLSVILRGEPPDPRHPPSGCRFRTQCPWAEQICVDRIPEAEIVPSEPGHTVACHRWRELPDTEPTNHT